MQMKDSGKQKKSNFEGDETQENPQNTRNNYRELQNN